MLQVRRPPLVADTIALGLYLANPGQFRLGWEGLNAAAGLDLTLVDRKLNMAKPLVKDSTYLFNVTSDSTTQGRHRFVLVARPGQALSTSALQLRAQAASNAQSVDLYWSTPPQPWPAQHWMLERSANGVQFQTAHQQPFRGSWAAHWTDAQPLDGTNYYRVKAQVANGTELLSPVAMARIAKAASLDCAPNVVANGRLNLLYRGMIPGPAKWQVLDGQGKVIYSLTSSIVGSGSQQLELPTLAAGLYRVLLDAGDQHFSTSFTVIR
jgi:hypothetical protein